MLSKVCDIIHQLWRLRFLESTIRGQPTTSEAYGDTLIGINRCIEARLHLGCQFRTTGMYAADDKANSTRLHRQEPSLLERSGKS